MNQPAYADIVFKSHGNGKLVVMVHGLWGDPIKTYEATTGLAKTFGGAYGLGIIYATTMFGAHEGAH